ncbi:FRIGIDA-like protein 5 isoform X2 [Quercus robur]|uniref:FRIGIDA-like protein 5 isoform X2 n=1 Tax=Quercus robur TaxID=38942 RepID=UPI00216362B5|nr:FRIGIDA-like protein 5 isoform X2 [Quercus robur]
MGKISSELEAAEMKKQTLRKTLEQIHSSSSSFLLFSLQWKDLEDHFDTARRFLQEQVQGLESKEKRFEELELREKRVEELSRGFEAKEERLRECSKEFELKEANLEERVREVESREERIEECSRDFEVKEKRYGECIRKLKAKEKRLGECLKELELKEKKIEEYAERIRELEVKEDGLKESWKELEEWNQVFELREKKIEERFGELEAKEKQLEARFKELELREESIGLRLKDIGLKEKRSEEIILNENKLGERVKELELKEKLFEKRIKELELRERRFADSLHTRVKTEPLEDFPVNNVVNKSSTASLRFCVTMDGKSLQIFLNERWKEHDSMRLEVATALRLSSDPAKLVLDAMEGFYPPRLKKGDVEFDESMVQGSCVLLLEQLLKLSPSVKPDVKQEAMRLAIEWRAKMRVDIEHSLEVLGFLQLLASYGLASAFDDDELIMYLEKVSEYEQLPGLCQILGVDNMAPVSCTVHSHVKSVQLSKESSLLDSRVASLAVNAQQDPKCVSVNVHGETLRSLLNKQVEYDSIQSKVSDALQSVLDPDKLVLDAIMGIYPSNLKGDEGFKLCFSRNFILLLKQLIGVLPQIKPLVKVEATKFANDWKSRLKKKRDDPLEVLAFLQFLVAYGLASSFYANEVLRLLDTDVWRKEIPDLCRVLGLTDIMPNFIQNHIKEEQQLEAIKYICALELVDNFPLVTLLNDHLKNSKRKAEDLCKEGNKSLPVQNRKSSRQRKSVSMTHPMSKMDLVLDPKIHYCNSINNNKQTVVPKLWGRRWILNKLIKFDHSILSRNVLLQQP